ncbi:hypothetical protein OCAE111667_03155 [Occultella aeris]|uniref:DUF11 domain-containing protein n=1 Tax=Occultella aeris TaxID=2761496 RepID=A0A7M4DDB3_9MICO|nr:hypothetical protein [Occultella aeris]VZO34832.1 hypothetical protein HALOF300_00102 [Occultella aeris]
MSTTDTTARTKGTQAIASTPFPQPSPNTVLADLEEALETYPQTYLIVQIYSVDPPGGSFNVGENATYKVRVHNDGPLDVDDLTLLMSGENGSRVGEHGWASGQISLQTPVFARVPAHMADDTWVEAPDDHYHLFVHQPLPANSALLKVSVKDWNTKLDHLTIGHSDPVLAANDIYRNQVLAD